MKEHISQNIFISQLHSNNGNSINALAWYVHDFTCFDRDIRAFVNSDCHVYFKNCI